jgi:hypothetical protein
MKKNGGKLFLLSRWILGLLFLLAAYFLAAHMIGGLYPAFVWGLTLIFILCAVGMIRKLYLALYPSLLLALLIMFTFSSLLFVFPAEFHAEPLRIFLSELTVGANRALFIATWIIGLYLLRVIILEKEQFRDGWW